MSKLLDKIKKQSETPSAQMGFRRTLPTPSAATISLIAKIGGADSAAPLKSIEGADAVVIDVSGTEITAKALKKLASPLGDVPWGVNLEESSVQAEELEESGADFVVFSPSSPVAGAPKDEKTGRIIQVDSSMDDGLISALNDLPVDAVLIDDIYGDNTALAYHHLMMVRYMAFLVRKPLIIPVPASISADELKALWNAGVEAVLVPVDISKDENLKALKEIAVKLPPRKADKNKKTSVSLPRETPQPAAPPPEEDDDE